jgi:hypothetical protein
MTRGRKPLVDTTNEYLGNANPVTIGEIGRGDVDEIEVVKDVSKADKLAFMEEPVTILVMSSGDQNEIPLVQVAVNGVTQFIRRDEPITVKRKYVERLARCKKTDFNQALDDSQGEVSFNVLTRRHSLRFPFSVIQDPNPNGAGWLKQILTEPV